VRDHWYHDDDRPLMVAGVGQGGAYLVGRRRGDRPGTEAGGDLRQVDAQVPALQPGRLGRVQVQRAGAVPETVLNEEAGRTPSGRLSRPADIARAVVFVSSAANGNITGEVLTVAGGR